VANERSLISYKSNAEELILQVEQYPRVVRVSKTRGLRSTGFFLTRRAKAYIASSGGGSWSFHPLTEKYGRGRKAFRRRRGKPGQALKDFVRYQSNRSASRLVVDVGLIKKAGKISKGESKFEKKLQEFSERFQGGSETPVDDRMRQRFGATRRKASDVPGVDYFPLRKATTRIYMDDRPIFEPVFAQTRPTIPKVFDKKFSERFVKEEKKL
jgi:hypothetical protein